MPGGGVTQIAQDQLLRDDPNLPFLETAWSCRKMAELFNREVLPSTNPGLRATAVKRADVIYSPGRKCVIRYSLHLDGAPGTESRWAVVSFAKDDRLEAVFLSQYARNEGRTDRQASDAVYLPRYRCLVELFPQDWRLPSLPLAMQPEKVASVLRRASPDANHASAAYSSEVKVLRYRPHYRCVFGYAMTPSAKSLQQMVGKIYPPGPEARQVWNAINILHPQRMELGVMVSRPLALEEEWNLVLMERAPGVSMKQLLIDARTPKEAAGLVSLAAAALATYHGLRFESPLVRSAQTELQKLRKRIDRLHLVAPSLAEQADALLQRVEALAQGCTFGKSSFIHGDCKPSQLLIDQGRVAIVDYDMACLGDPAIDIGNFMAQFLKYALSTGQGHLRQLAPYFLAEYQARSSADGLAERAHLFQALSLVRMAVRTFQWSPHSYARKGQSSPQVLLLREAAACLAQL